MTYLEQVFGKLALQENSEIVVKKMCGLMAHARSVGQT